MFFKIRKNVIFFCIVITCLFLAYATYMFYTEFHALDPSANVGLLLFYNLQSAGMYFVYVLVLLLIASNSVGLSNLMDYKTKFVLFEFLREKSIEKTILKQLKGNFIFSFMVSLLLKLVYLLYIHLFLRPIDLSIPLAGSYDQSLVPGIIMNLLFYLLLSSIGFGIFSVFLQLIGLFIKNDYVFRGLGIVIGILLIIGPAVLGSLSDQLAFLSNVLFLPMLITPGIDTLPIVSQYPPIFVVGASLLIYAFITILLAWLWIRKVEKYDI
ncbi:hypothetical protein BH747_00870 [Enterococcus villorum]|uniref:Uncharacterized protein n=1 Tax=Enterococcus villorum TaxID=112904 RepID=A0A1V8YGH8_9ENTE|nr:hypothetical protein [Enterococcus villorum]OQO71416.1 hypothetical protein BH747_00870 [Enterococcus villorum]OQO73610.1 hypothetical protein BH744_09420 [Enterococcus villorum]